MTESSRVLIAPNTDEEPYSLVFVADPTDSATIPIGKQALNPSHIFYRPCSGIWQSVWLEPAPADHVVRLDVAANAAGEGQLCSIMLNCWNDSLISFEKLLSTSYLLLKVVRRLKSPSSTKTAPR